MHKTKKSTNLRLEGRDLSIELENMILQLILLVIIFLHLFCLLSPKKSLKYAKTNIFFLLLLQENLIDYSVSTFTNLNTPFQCTHIYPNLPYKKYLIDSFHYYIHDIFKIKHKKYILEIERIISLLDLPPKLLQRLSFQQYHSIPSQYELISTIQNQKAKKIKSLKLLINTRNK